MSLQPPREPERPVRALPGFALREVVREGYTRSDFRADLLAGAVIALIAVPLSMALGIASGVDPQNGIYTAIVGGFVIALLGGSRWQVSGPTAAFVVLLAPLAAKYGLAGLACASLVAGVALILLGLARLGKAIEFIPYPVTTGFTAGIAVVIATLQVKDFLGLTVADMPDEYHERLVALVHALPTWRPHEFVLGLTTLLVIVYWPKVSSRIPAPLIALPAAALAGVALAHWNPEWSVETIRDRFSYAGPDGRLPGIPPYPPMLHWPWNLPGAGGEAFVLDSAAIQDITLKGLTIALLGAIESLLSAVVADGMQGTRHDPDAELIAQGAGNLVAPLFGGFAATGALARTATNIRSGARSPLAGAMHAVIVLIAVVALAPWLGYLPMAAMAALLLRVAWQMSEVRHFVHTVRIAPRSDVLLLLTCFGMTVVLDMVKAVGVGVILAAFIFMKRMADVGDVGTVQGGQRHRDLNVPKGAVLFAITGPLFFGSAGKATRALRAYGDDARVVILDLTFVPVLDGTGLANLEVCIERLRARKTMVIVAGVQPQPLRTMVHAGWRHRREFLTVRRDLRRAIEDARAMLQPGGPAAPPGPATRG